MNRRIFPAALSRWEGQAATMTTLPGPAPAFRPALDREADMHRPIPLFIPPNPLRSEADPGNPEPACCRFAIGCRRLSGTLAAAFLCLLLAVPFAAAQTVVRVPQDAATLQAAFGQVPDDGIIELAAGTYTAPSGGWLLASPGKSFTVRGAQGAQAILSGAGIDPILQIIHSAPETDDTFVFENLVVEDGVSTENGLAGGITLTRSTATFANVVFRDNSSQASSTGGGAVAVFTDSNGHFFDCTFSNNDAVNEGGGLRVGGNSTAYVHRGRFEGNRVNLPGHRRSSAGGAIHITDSEVWITNSRFVGNEAAFVGGAIFALGTWNATAAPATSVLIANSSFVENANDPDPGTTAPPSPPTGGALHGEDDVLVRIYNSRFEKHSSVIGGTFGQYRSRLELYDVTVRDSVATGDGSTGGTGGVLVASSNDVSNATTNNGAINRPSAELLIEGSLFQGTDLDTGSSQNNSLKGGCIFVAGDTNRAYGRGGVDADGTPASNRAQVEIRDSVLYDCVAARETDTPGTGTGGGLNLSLSDLTLADVLLANNQGSGATGTSGGGMRVVTESSIDLDRTTVAYNKVGLRGGGALYNGSTVSIADSSFFGNENESGEQGHAIWAEPGINTFGTENFDIDGTVVRTTFSDNMDIMIRDEDRAAGPKNEIVYNDNDFFPESSGARVYRDNVAGVARTVAELNTLVVTRNPGVGNTVKSTVDNTELGSRPNLGALLAVPPRILQVPAVDEPGGATDAFLGFAWNSGGSATLDGAPLLVDHDVRTAGAGNHTLSVAGVDFSASITTAPVPSSSFAAVPPTLGSPVDLEWSTDAGRFLAVTIDRGRSPAQAASGSVTVDPDVPKTYRLLVVTEEGGAFATVTPGNVGDIFADGFETGTTSEWSSATGL